MKPACKTAAFFDAEFHKFSICLVDYKEIIDEWCKEDGINVYLTIDNEQEGWDGHVGFVPNYVKELVGEDVIENIPSPAPGMESIAH